MTDTFEIAAADLAATARDLQVEAARTTAGYPDGPISYTLRKPVELITVVAGRDPERSTITSVTVREPVGEDLFVTDRAKGESDKAARLIAQLCDQPYQFAKKLSGWDFTQLGQIVARFFPTEG